MTVLLDRDGLAAGFRSRGPAAASTAGALTPLDLLARVFPRTVRTPALELVNDAVVWAEATPDARLIVTMAPQEAKSSTVTRAGSLYFLRQDPRRRLVVASYADRLARRWGRQVRNDITSHSGQRGGFDMGLRLASDAQARDEWETVQGGGMYSVGVRGSLTGRQANCVTGPTVVVTPAGYVAIRDLDPRNLPQVLSWNHHLRRAEWRQVQALTCTPDRTVVEIRTREGRTLRCTPDHRIHTPEGYRSAALLQPGDRITAGRWEAEAGAVLGVPRVRGVQAESVRRVQGVRDEGAAGDGRARVRALREDVHPADGGAREGDAAGPGRDLLRAVLRDPGEHHQEAVPGVRQDAASVGGADLPRVQASEHGPVDVRPMRGHVRAARSRGREANPSGWAALLLQGVRWQVAAYRWAAVRAVREARRAPSGRGEVLRSRVPAGGPGGPPARAGAVLPALRAGVPAEVVPAPVLLPDLRGPGARGSHGRGGEPALPGRPVLRGVVQADAAPHRGTGRARVPGLPVAGQAAPLHVAGETAPAVEPGRAPHRRAALEQRPGEPHPPVQDVPRGAPQVGADTVSVVRVLHGERHAVYDIQVEGNHNFFADEVLVHNCMIVDDPVKDRKEAESPTLMGDVWEWWESTASSRLAPGAPVILVMTRWSHNDLAGRLLRAQPGVWRLLHIPAQADPKLVDPDPLGRAPGEYMVSAQGRTLAQWEARKRDAGAEWAPLYQGNPQDPGGETFDVDKLGWWRLAPDGQAVVLGPHTWRLSECRRFGTVDTASSTSSAADFTVAAAWAVTPAGDLVLLDVRRERVPEHRQVGLAEPLAARWGLDCTYVESTMAGTRLVRDMVQAGRRIQDLRADRSKTARAALAASWVDQGRVAFPAQGMAASLPDAVLTDVLEELRHFPAGRHDDFVDNLAYAAAVTLDTYLPPDSGRWEPQRREPGVSESAFGAEPIDDLMSRPF